MNLSRITKTLLFCLMALGFSQAAQAQAQLAGVNQDGLIQLGANHPFVVSTYEMDISHLGLSSQPTAADFFHKYVDEGYTVSFRLADQTAVIEFNLAELGQMRGIQVDVATMNQKLRDVHRLRK